jgi:hypothetical protein
VEPKDLTININIFQFDFVLLRGVNRETGGGPDEGGDIEDNKDHVGYGLGFLRKKTAVWTLR